MSIKIETVTINISGECDTDKLIQGIQKQVNESSDLIFSESAQAEVLYGVNIENQLEKILTGLYKLTPEARQWKECWGGIDKDGSVYLYSQRPIWHDSEFGVDEANAVGTFHVRAGSLEMEQMEFLEDQDNTNILLTPIRIR